MSRHLTLWQRIYTFTYVHNYVHIYVSVVMSFYLLLFLLSEIFTFCFPAYFCQSLACMWLQACWIFSPTRRPSATMYLCAQVLYMYIEYQLLGRVVKVFSIYFWFGVKLFIYFFECCRKKYLLTLYFYFYLFNVFVFVIYL